MATPSVTARFASADTVNHRWWDWTPLRPGNGNYITVIKALDDQQHAAIACGQTPLLVAPTASSTRRRFTSARGQ